MDDGRSRTGPWRRIGLLSALLLGLAGPGRTRAQPLPPPLPDTLYLPLLARQARLPWPAATLPTATAEATATGGAQPTPVATAVLGRPWPDSRAGIRVFNDQLPGLGNLTEAQIRFAVDHYVGTQKLTRPDADRLRALDPDFLILHYRLGMGLGYRGAQGDCQPTGDYLMIVDGARWVREWPEEALLRPSWFFSWEGQERVFFCPNGWYLMNLDDPGYRDWWMGEVLRQLEGNDNDGLFADSLSVPNLFGGSVWRPRLPDLDPAFEAAWGARIDGWLAALKARMGPRHALLPNAGNWVNSRDPVTYAAADGLMVEGFASWGPGRYYDPADWRLQMNRILKLTQAGRILIAQSYPDPEDVEHRLFTVASYLLVKGRRSYLNQEYSMAPEWWPEYDLPLGAYLAEPPASVDALLDPTMGVYRRDYENGLVLVNPGPEAKEIFLDRPLWYARPRGGGLVPPDGRLPTSWGWAGDGRSVQTQTLAPNQAAVLVYVPPAGTAGR